MGLFSFLKAKPGGSKAGNFLRSIVNGQLGTNLQPPKPLPVAQGIGAGLLASIGTDAGMQIKPPSFLSRLGDTVINAIGTGTDSAKKVGGTATIAKYGIIAIVLILIFSMFRKRR